MNFLPHEIDFFSKTEPMLLKKRVIQKVIKNFEALSDKLMNELNFDALINDAAIQNKSGKITKGENHHHLPFVVLDAPFLVRDEDLFTFRTLFWWGKYITFNVIVKGETFTKLAMSIIDYQFDGNNLFAISQNDIWINDIDSQNYKKLERSILMSSWEQNKFIRISKKLEMHNIENLEPMALGFYLDLLCYLTK